MSNLSNQHLEQFPQFNDPGLSDKSYLHENTSSYARTTISSEDCNRFYDNYMQVNDFFKIIPKSTNDSESTIKISRNKKFEYSSKEHFNLKPYHEHLNQINFTNTQKTVPFKMTARLNLKPHPHNYKNMNRQNYLEPMFNNYERSNQIKNYPGDIVSQNARYSKQPSQNVRYSKPSQVVSKYFHKYRNEGNHASNSSIEYREARNQYEPNYMHYENNKTTIANNNDHLIYSQITKIQLDDSNQKSDENEIYAKLIELFVTINSISKAHVFSFQKKLETLLKSLNFKDLRIKYLDEFIIKFLINGAMDNEDIESLTKTEKVLFLAFLVKKRYHHIDSFSFSPENLMFYGRKKTMKRNEQEYKIILKKAFNSMINSHNQENNIFNNSKTHFYKKYFGEFAEEHNLSIDDLQLENLFNEKKTTFFKKRKSKKNYAQILRTSTNFLSKLSEYLNNRFSVGSKINGSGIDAMKEIEKKVPNLINKWKVTLLMYEEDSSNEQKFTNFFLNLFANRKIKLPWSLNEVERAVVSVKTLLQIN